MAEIELEREMLLKMSFTEGYNTKALQKDADCVAVPSAGDKTYCTESQLDCCPYSHNLKLLDNKLRPIKIQLHQILRKAEEFQTRLIYSKDNGEKESFSRGVPIFLKICEPYFDYLESAARNTSCGRSALPQYIRTQLLQFSQQLCSQLEQLVLAYASYGYIGLAEMDPMCISHFYIGRCQLDEIKVSIFRYCQPTPFLALTSNGLYKHMRWNVEKENGTDAGEKNDDRIERTQATEGEIEPKRERRMEGNSTEYYFLCHEDIQSVDGDVKTDTRTGKESVQRTWSVGKWLQIFPDPDTEDINDWVLCTIPQGLYKPLAYLGAEEPSSCMATACLLEVLLSQAEERITHPITNQKNMSANKE